MHKVKCARLECEGLIQIIKLEIHNIVSNSNREPVHIGCPIWDPVGIDFL